MSGGGVSGDRDAVLEAVRAFYSGDGGNELIGGPLLEWTLLVDQQRPARVEVERALESAELVELTDDHAVVEVRAAMRVAAVRGTWETEIRLDGPTVLERIDGRWVVVDLTASGRRRLESIVFGPLAEQEQAGVTVRVLGVDRSSYATSYVVELVNTTDDELNVDRAYGLFETETAWSRLDRRQPEPIPPHGTGRVSLHGSAAVELTDPMLAISLRVRAGRRKLPFLLKVPLTKPEQLSPQRPPRVLPLVRSTWPRHLAFWAAITAATWWYASWIALLVPVFMAVGVYGQLRATGRLPERLDPVRYLLDALVAVGLFLLLWLTPAVVFAVPVAVGALVYFVLWRFARRQRELRLIAALAVASGWLFLLGNLSAPLSPCRLADGPAAGKADRFMQALLTDVSSAARADAGEFLPDGVLPKAVSDDAADRLIARRATDRKGSYCRLPEFTEYATDCFDYPAPPGASVSYGDESARVKGYSVAVDCGGRHWEIDGWYPVF